MSTKTKLKPRPVRKVKTMNEQTPDKKDYPQMPVDITEQPKSTQVYNKVQSHLPDIQLIDRNALWDDFKNRVKINNYECREALADLKRVVKQSQPYIDKAVTKVKELTKR